MRVEKKYFEEILKEFKARGYIYDDNARLFCKTLITNLALNKTNERANNLLYVRVHREMRLVDCIMNLSLLDGSYIVSNPPKDQYPLWMYATGLVSYFSIPLEILGCKKVGSEDNRPKWKILLLRDINRGYGYVNDDLSQKLFSIGVDMAYVQRSSGLTFSEKGKDHLKH